MDIIGLTGGIASGKSTAGRMFVAAGIPVIDADVLARDAVAPGSEGLAQIVERFGDEILGADGTLDRAKMGALVFAHAEERSALNGIVHPHVAHLFAAAAMKLDDDGHTRLVYEVPLLFENNLEGMMKATILIASDEDTQIKRVTARDGLSADDARARIAAQLPLAEKRARATVVVENGGSVSLLAERLRGAWKKITNEDVDFEIAADAATTTTNS